MQDAQILEPSFCLLEEEDGAIYSSLPPKKEQWIMKTHGIFTI